MIGQRQGVDKGRRGDRSSAFGTCVLQHAAVAHFVVLIIQYATRATTRIVVQLATLSRE